MSYFRVLGLDREPFSTSPDPAFFYQSPKHRSVLANLLIEFRLRRGLSVVLGDIGTGKTTLGRKLIQMLKERERFIFHLVLDPTYPSEDLFFSVTSPGFLIWWATIGASVFLEAALHGPAGLAAVGLGHALADIIWCWFVAFSVEQGKRYVSDRTYRLIMSGIAVWLIVLGLGLPLKHYR